ncbi:DUF7222 domain-containing protein [Flavobacterium sp. 3HN19-14]|uniref:DUF7222 domain-containing protein n=1 Tax=Flavobacterium sp. 3HN19-14 TaxID=3448133 RepID=UPI003EE34514
MSTKQKFLKKQLNKIIKANPNSIRAEVAIEALSYRGDIETFFSNLLSYGCQSGMISKLIYYCDTHSFFNTHYNEIDALREELEDDLGAPLQPKGDLKNWYAWMAFEETARYIAEELGL